MNDRQMGNSLFQDRFLFLLIVLLATLTLVPTIDAPGVQRFLGYTALVLVFLVGANANRRRLAFFALAIVFAGVAIILTLSRLIVGLGVLEIPRLINAIVFFGLTAVMILVGVVRDEMPTRQAVNGGICAYLLLGLAWAHGYLLIERLDPAAFHFVEKRVGMPLSDDVPTMDTGQMVYFSFTTQTTLGLGDIAPRSPVAETATWLQAVTGQLFLAILIAKLVSELPHFRRAPD